VPSMKKNTLQQLETDRFELKLNGRWHPDWCIPRQRIAIIVPFRDRQSHLAIFLRNIHPFLQRQLNDYTVFIVEQVILFNSIFILCRFHYFRCTTYECKKIKGCDELKFNL